MAETESTRIEIGFNGGQIMSAIVTSKSADALELAVSGGSDGMLNLDAEDGRYTVVLSHVAYMKRFAREARVGFEAKAG
jgi:hypothetical protein